MTVADSAPAITTMPRLSEDLTIFGEAYRYRCMSCRIIVAPPSMEWYQEHDDDGRPQPIVVPLCWGCSPEFIAEHPRRYRHLAPNEPIPGALLICTTCIHRDTRAGLRCGNLAAKANGGAGLRIRIAKPTEMHIEGIRGRDGKLGSSTELVWPNQATGCTGYIKEP